MDNFSQLNPASSGNTLRAKVDLYCFLVCVCVCVCFVFFERKTEKGGRGEAFPHAHDDAEMYWPVFGSLEAHRHLFTHCRSVCDSCGPFSPCRIHVPHIFTKYYYQEDRFATLHAALDHFRFYPTNAAHNSTSLYF